MRAMLLSTTLALLLALPAQVSAVEIAIDGVATIKPSDPAEGIPPEFNGFAVIDIVGGTSNSSTRNALAKGNAYRVDNSVVLNEAEFWLSFSGTQTVNVYVFDSPAEFGTYNEVYRSSGPMTGTGAAWYSSGPIAVPMSAGMYYIIAVSWSGTVTYYYNVGDTQATSFGAHVHGYATGVHPLPTTISSTVNDQAIYYQRLTTDLATPVEPITWGGIKAVYR